MSTRTLGTACAWMMVAVLVGLVGCFVSACAKNNEIKGKPEDIELAIDLASRGDVAAGITKLEAVVRTFKKGPVGDRAALVLGNMLAGQRRFAESVPYLERAAGGSVAAEYANVLLAKAIIDGGLTEKYPFAAERLTKASATDGISPILKEDADYLSVCLANAREQWDQTVTAGRSFLSSWPSSKDGPEVRWITAEALRTLGRSADAHEMYQSIWNTQTKSRWALQARDNMRRIESESGITHQRLAADQQYKLIKDVVAAGMPSPAIEEIDTFLRENPGSSRTPEILSIKARCFYDLRKNDECVETANLIRGSYPNSDWSAAACIQAIQALRRNSSNSPAIRDWANYVASHFPGTGRAHEAMYSYATHLGNDVSLDQGIAALEQVANEAGTSEFAHDALYRLAWFQRKQGNTDAAVQMLRRLVNEHPDTGYRKGAMYWIARFTESTDRTGAIALYQTCVKEFPHDFYGFRAQENLVALGVKPEQQGNMRRFPERDRLDDASKGPAGQDGYARAVSLKQIGLYEFAAAELASVPSASKDPSLQLALAHLYSKAGNTWEAIGILSKNFEEFVTAGSHDTSLVPMEFWQTMYPYNYKAEIRKTLAESGIGSSGINEYVVASLIRNESRFWPEATSSVGAIGLMQLMPGTADAIAREKGLPSPNKTDLFVPETNIQYGTYYLANMVKRFRGDWFPAICSYNAGPEVVERWWTAKPPEQDQDEFIESIPYQATRLYIKRILGDYRMYQWIYKQGS
jgi:soluble lytic murein transglycosylase-like protein/outer membrane protein assembly factor BamD (BamD/ComL family)